MVVIKFADIETQDEAVGFLATHFPGRLLRSGEVIVPEDALEALANESFSFTVIGKATYDQMAALRDPAARKA
jgi:hypothetical protein